MYAIVETGGKQYRVKPGDTVAVERLDSEPGDTLDLDRVLLIAGNGDDKTRVGSPGVAGAVVRAEVVEHIRGEKIIVFRYKSKVRYRRKTGHRQSLTRLRITDILLDGASAVTAAKPAEATSSGQARTPEAGAPAEAAAPTGAVEPGEAAESMESIGAEPTAPRRRRAAPASAAESSAAEGGESKPASEGTEDAEGGTDTNDTKDTRETKA